MQKQGTSTFLSRKVLVSNMNLTSNNKKPSFLEGQWRPSEKLRFLPSSGSNKAARPSSGAMTKASLREFQSLIRLYPKGASPDKKPHIHSQPLTRVPRLHNRQK